MFFTNLALHFGAIPIVRNGILMCRFVVYHSDELKHPHSIFILGCLIMIVNIFCASTNMYNSMLQDKVSIIIGKFVAFLVFLQVQDFYFKARVNVGVKKSVAANPVVIEIDSNRVKNPIHYWIDWFIRNVIVTFYFYFFPFFGVVYPLEYLLTLDHFEIE